MSKSAKEYRIERDVAYKRISALEAEIRELHVTPSRFTREEILNKHDDWLLRIMKKGTIQYEEMRQLQLFRNLMFKNWNRFQ